jgi:RND family efflux transporter MFP subunit
MKSFYTLLLISFIGLGIGIVNIYTNDKPVEVSTNPIQELQLPFNSFIAATGIVEAESKNINVGSLISGLVTKVYVRSGDRVKKGELLFELDSSQIKNQLPSLQAEIKLATSKLQSALHQLKIIQEFKKVSSGMVTTEKIIAKEDAVKNAQMSLRVAKSNLKKITNELAFYRVYSPIDGVVLNSKLNIGTYFKTNSQMLSIGSDNLNLRVSINEYDAYRFKPNSKTIAYLRGHNKIKTEVKYLYTRPFVTPKTHMSGVSTERTDTRVLEVVYSIPKELSFPLYVGQQLDVFIKSEVK